MQCKLVEIINAFKKSKGCLIQKFDFNLVFIFASKSKGLTIMQREKSPRSIK